jgi:hypothetical protein
MSRKYTFSHQMFIYCYYYYYYYYYYYELLQLFLPHLLLRTPKKRENDDDLALYEYLLCVTLVSTSLCYALKLKE